jgi:DNA-binding PadR family transcriptional regulator
MRLWTSYSLIATTMHNIAVWWLYCGRMTHDIAKEPAVTLRDYGAEAGVEDMPPMPTLSEQAFQILVALADRDRHGYGIQRDIDRRTGGVLCLAPGTLYGALTRLVAAGYIRAVYEGEEARGDNAQRRYYALTEIGRAVVAARASWLVDLGQTALERLQATHQSSSSAREQDSGSDAAWPRRAARDSGQKRTAMASKLDAYILTCLHWEGSMHEYGIGQSVTQQLGEAAGFHRGTLSKALRRMVAAGLITVGNRDNLGPEPRRRGGPPRRRYYKLTMEGRRYMASRAPLDEELIKG